jgi:hypothetical protein
MRGRESRALTGSMAARGFTNRKGAMQDRWMIAVKRRTVLLVSLLGSVGLLIPSQAFAMPPSTGSGTEGADVVFASTFGGIRHEGRRHRIGKGKSKHQKKITVGEARTKGKARPTARGRGRQQKVVCAEAFDKAKETVRDSQFRAAKEWFAKCARPTCRRPLRQQCAALREEVVAALPTVVPVVTDAAGPLDGEVQVKMDGELLTSNVDGTAIVVDPGEHEFTFAKEGEVFATRKVAIEKGQRNQIVSVSFQDGKRKSIDLAASPVAEERATQAEPRKAQVTGAVEETAAGDDEPAPSVARRGQRRASVEADTRTGAPWSAYALAGVGLLGIGGYGVFTLKGRADNDALIALCKPTCMETSVKHVRNLYLAADISLGIGVAALAASTYLFLKSGGSEEASASTRSSTSHISGLAVEPTASGAVATVGGTF